MSITTADANALIPSALAERGASTAIGAAAPDTIAGIRALTKQKLTNLCQRINGYRGVFNCAHVALRVDELLRHLAEKNEDPPVPRDRANVKASTTFKGKKNSGKADRLYTTDQRIIERVLAEWNFYHNRFDDVQVDLTDESRELEWIDFKESTQSVPTQKKIRFIKALRIPQSFSSSSASSPSAPSSSSSSSSSFSSFSSSSLSASSSSSSSSSSTANGLTAVPLPLDETKNDLETLTIIDQLRALPKRKADNTAYGFVLYLIGRGGTAHIINFYVDEHNEVYFIDAQRPNEKDWVFDKITLPHHIEDVFFINSFPPEGFKPLVKADPGIQLRPAAKRSLVKKEGKDEAEQFELKDTYYENRYLELRALKESINHTEFQEIERLANEGDIQSCWELATCYQQGFMVQINFQKAFDYFKKAVDKGHPAALTDIVTSYVKDFAQIESIANLNQTQRYKQVFELAQQASTMGYNDGHRALGGCYANSIGYHEGDASYKALDCFLRALAQSNKNERVGRKCINSIISLGNKYLIAGCDSRFTTHQQKSFDAFAFRCFDQIKEFGRVEAIRKLADCYAENRGAPQLPPIERDNLIFLLYRKASWQRDPISSFKLGKMYLEGRGVPAPEWSDRFNLAFKNLMFAAENGVVEAYEHLASCHYQAVSNLEYEFSSKISSLESALVEKHRAMGRFQRSSKAEADKLVRERINNGANPLLAGQLQLEIQPEAASVGPSPGLLIASGASASISIRSPVSSCLPTGFPKAPTTLELPRSLTRGISHSPSMSYSSSSSLPISSSSSSSSSASSSAIFSSTLSSHTMMALPVDETDDVPMPDADGKEPLNKRARTFQGENR